MVAELAEVLLAQAVERRAVELGGAADEVMDLRLEGLGGLAVVPGLLGDVAVVDEHVRRGPVLRLAPQPVPALEQQDPLARGGEAIDEGAAPGAAADDDHVVVAHPVTSCDPLGQDDPRGRLDQREVREGLREVAQVAARAGVELLGVEAERRRDAEQPLHQVAGTLPVADDRERRHQPERADQEAPLLAGEAVVGLAGPVAEDEAVLRQVVGDGLDRLAQRLVAGGQEAEDRGQQRRRVERIGVVVLAEHAVADAVLEDVRPDLVGGAAPGLAQPRVAGDLGELGRAVERDPAHQLRRDVLLGLAAGLPDPLIGLAPDLRGALGLLLDDRPEPPRQPLAAAGVEQDRVERRPVDVVLALVEGAVADPHRMRPRVPGQLVARGLGEVAAPVDAVHDLERPVAVGLEVGEELHELVGLPVEVQEVEGLKREGRVPDPGVAVVPVALSAGRLGQRGGGCRHRRAGRHVGEALDRERGALDRVAPAVVGEPGAAQPAPPVAGRRRQAPVGLVHVLRHDEALGPGERAVGLLALLERVPGPHPVALYAERHVRPQPHREAVAACVGRVTVVAHERPGGGCPPVVEVRVADQLHVDVPLEAEHRPHQHVVAVVVGRGAGVRRDLVLPVAGAHRQRVANEHPAGGGLPRGGHDVRPGLVDARRRHVDPERAEPERARLAVQQHPEHARRVEARHAEPVDRTVRGHEGGGVAVGQEGVVGDRRERRRRRGALRGGLLGGAHAATQGPRQEPRPATRPSAAAGPQDPFS